MTDTPPIAVVRGFVDAFGSTDLAAIGSFLAPDLVAEVTQPDGGTAQLQGRDAYMASIEALDLPSVRPSITATQIAQVTTDQVMVMIEIKAARKGRKLHNFAAFLMRVFGGHIARIWMVEALPAESDAFWKD